MINAIMAGISSGLLLSILIGPVFFMLIRTSIHHGFRAAMALEAGICLSDTFCILLAYFGIGQYINNPKYVTLITWIGALILMIFGIVTYRTNSKYQKIKVEISETFQKLFIKGFLFNTSNPSVIFFWIAAVAIASNQFLDNKFFIFIYFFATLTTVFLIDVVKAKLAQNLSSKLNNNILSIISKVAGALIFLFGIFLLVKLYFYE
jgi:threonine/homoserine/homoserine lactone efflux protein